MPGTGDSFEVNQRPNVWNRMVHDLSATGSSDACRAGFGEVCVSISGTATSVVAIVERAGRDDQSDWAPADDASLSGNLATTGIPSERYMEPSRGWWRVRFTTLSGGTAKVTITGPDA